MDNCPKCAPGVPLRRRIGRTDGSGGGGLVCGYAHRPCPIDGSVYNVGRRIAAIYPHIALGRLRILDVSYRRQPVSASCRATFSRCRNPLRPLACGQARCAPLAPDAFDRRARPGPTRRTYAQRSRMERIWYAIAESNPHLAGLWISGSSIATGHRLWISRYRRRSSRAALPGLHRTDRQRRCCGQLPALACVFGAAATGRIARFNGRDAVDNPPPYHQRKRPPIRRPFSPRLGSKRHACRRVTGSTDCGSRPRPPSPAPG